MYNVKWKYRNTFKRNKVKVHEPVIYVYLSVNQWISSVGKEIGRH